MYSTNVGNRQPAQIILLIVSENKCVALQTAVNACNLMLIVIPDFTCIQKVSPIRDLGYWVTLSNIFIKIHLILQNNRCTKSLNSNQSHYRRNSFPKESDFYWSCQLASIKELVSLKKSRSQLDNTQSTCLLNLLYTHLNAIFYVITVKQLNALCFILS